MDFVDDSIFADERNLIPGQRYKIVLEDCCINGEIEGTFKAFDEKEDRYVFDIGQIGPGWGKWKTEAIVKEENQK